MTNNVHQLFPNKTRVTHNGVQITVTRETDGTASWEFTQPMKSLRMTGASESVEAAQARARELIDNFSKAGVNAGRTT